MIEELGRHDCYAYMHYTCTEDKIGIYERRYVLKRYKAADDFDIKKFSQILELEKALSSGRESRSLKK